MTAPRAFLQVWRDCAARDSRPTAELPTNLLIVGEDNPRGPDPRLALFPVPRGAAGARLCGILGVSRAGLLAAWRVNLCDVSWAGAAAVQRARELLTGPWDAYLLLGSRATSAVRYAIAQEVARAAASDMRRCGGIGRPYRAAVQRQWTPARIVEDPRTVDGVHDMTLDVPSDDDVRSIRLLTIPHPSGRCRRWNDPRLADAARAALADAVRHADAALTR